MSSDDLHYIKKKKKYTDSFSESSHKLVISPKS